VCFPFLHVGVSIPDVQCPADECLAKRGWFPPIYIKSVAICLASAFDRLQSPSACSVSVDVAAGTDVSHMRGGTFWSFPHVDWKFPISIVPSATGFFLFLIILESLAMGGFVV
jgi:hypothetical protein